MDEQHKTYKGRNIVVRPRVAEAAAEAAEAELYIDDEPVTAIRDRAGMYIAAGYAYDPQNSLTDLAQRIIDYREAAQQGDNNGRP